METPMPLHYRLHIEPDLAAFRFDGILHLAVSLPVPTTEVVLNSVELSVVSCCLDGGAPCPFSVDPEGEALRISLPRPMTGEISLEIIYTGVINDRMEGFYRSRYSKGGEDRYLAVTQFEESSARMALPCFDHPAQKATFDVTLVVDKELSAFSNGDILEEVADENGKKRVVFETTPKMSTYLLFFGVGEFELVLDAVDKRVRAACVPGSGHLLGMGLEVARHSLAFCEEYFGVPYPMTKLDHIAVPDFAFGAMENWGAVVFRENLLLYDPAKTSQAGKERICEVVAHEIVHQWFGNLVTPEDWKYLWLNESYATFFANRILDRIHPDWQVWDQFLHTTISVAMVRDALENTLPIEIPGGEHVVINAATAPIIYNKGGGVLLQMRGYLGEEDFRKGLTHYLKTHAYGSTQSHHLWDAYGAVTEKPVATMMQAWVSQPGFPLVTVTRNGDTLAFSQARFSYLGAESDLRQLWPIPLNIALFSDTGEETRFDILLDKPEAMLHLPPGAMAIKINAGQSGFYRVHYASEEMLTVLGSLVSEKKLSPADRWGLQEDLFALVRAGKAPLPRYLDFIEAYGEEEDFLPAMGITGNLHLAYLISEGSLRDRVAAAGKAFLEGVLHRIGYLPHEAESNTTRMLRDAVLFRAVLFGSETVLAWGEEYFQNLMEGREVHPDIQRSILQIGAWAMPDAAFPWLRDRFRKSESEHERMNLLAAMGALSNEETLKEAFSFTLAEVPQRNRHLPMAAAAANPEALGFMWEWITACMADLEQLHPLLFERVMDALVPLCGLGREEAVKTFFDEYLLRAKTGEATLRIALEFLEVNGNTRRGGA